MNQAEQNTHYNILEEYDHPNQRYEQQQQQDENTHHDSYYDQQNQYNLPSSHSYLHQPYSEHLVSTPSAYTSSSSHYPQIPSSTTSKNGGIYDWLLETYGDEQSNMNSIYTYQSLKWSVGIALFVILIFHTRGKFIILIMKYTIRIFSFPTHTKIIEILT